MGKIDKEKLLKELPCYNSIGCRGKECKNFVLEETISGCIIKMIKNFPEEPEIDFDSLYQEFCDLDNVIRSVVSFLDFLKSKNLTAPQIDMDQLRNDVYSEIVKPKQVEIPVKKIFTLKKEYAEFCKSFGFEVDSKVITDKDLQYFDLHEEPDYSKIPYRSIIEVTGKMDANNRIVDYFKKYENGFLLLGFTTVKADLFNIRIVELAKE